MTKRRVVVKELLAAGFVPDAGSKHEKFYKDGHTITVPRHRELKDYMANIIRKQAGLYKRS